MKRRRAGKATVGRGRPGRSLPAWIKLGIYFVARLAGVFALCRHLTRSHLRILGYHGASVGDEDRFNPFLFLPPRIFRRRVAWLLAKGFTVVPLQQAVESLHRPGALGRLPTVITFDDGWQSTADRLIPVLADRGLPSTLYLSTGDFLQGFPIPAVVLRYLLWTSGRDEVDMGEAGTPVDGRHALADPEGARRFVDRAVRWLEQSSDRDGMVAKLDRLARALGVDPAGLDLASRRFDYLSHDDLPQLAARGCTVELHGHRHRYPRGEPDVFAADLAACRDAIRDLGLPEPRHYCYPSGNFDRAAAATLERLGLESATTCVPEWVRAAHGASRYFLPRLLDSGDMHMLEFEAELSGFAPWLRRITGR